VDNEVATVTTSLHLSGSTEPIKRVLTVKEISKYSAYDRLVGIFSPIKEKAEQILCVFASILTLSGGKRHTEMVDDEFLEVP